jgi:hypothetical protein
VAHAGGWRGFSIAWLRAGEVSMVDRLKAAFEDLNALDRN